ncbi:DUF6873 family GME fold protein, partial [Gudongella sp. DL1XJH-153]|uniref:DUF6873 family GME fold protein n=1 Tax=Gudongella sp. DL1XJH-153 TaxID=3409804 RepID=UPI003BB69069
MIRIVKNPYAPDKRVSVAIISKDSPLDVFNSLEELGIKAIPTIPSMILQPYLANHPDMVLTPLGDGSVVAAPSVWDYYNLELSKFGIKVIKGNVEPSVQYPDDIPYNAAFLENTLIHKLDYSERVILEYADKFEMLKLNTKQGYSKCSLAIVDNRSAITSDKGMAKLLNANGFDLLLIEQGYIDLPGMKYGFIGGATGLLSPKEMAITGTLERHPDKGRIEKFISQKGISLIYLSAKPAIDIGT